MNQKGQTLIFVVLVMTVALAIGIQISSRTISTVRRTTNVDSSSRALAAAEAGAEYYLAQSPASLNTILTTAPNNIPDTDCTTVSSPITYPPSGTLSSDFQSNSTITIQRWGCMNTSSPNNTLDVDIPEGKVFEIKAPQGAINSTRNLEVCWRTGSPATSLYTITIYGNNEASLSIGKNGLNKQVRSNGFTNVVSADCSSFVNLMHNTAPSQVINPRVIRIMSLYGDSQVTLRNNGSNIFPYQGYIITSVGTAGGSQGGTSRTVVARKTLPYLPAAFNFALYAPGSGL